jgi:hypothetical protein
MAKISDEIREFLRRARADGLMDLSELDAIADRIDAEMVELPRDRDGEYIHIGDVMEWCDSGETLTVEGIGSDVLFYIDGENAEWTAARNKRYHHEPTVEDVLQEMLFKAHIYDKREMELLPDLIAEYAARLRLAGEDA